jgi:hypothetical protein
VKGDHEFSGKPNGSKVGGYARARVQIGFDDDDRKLISQWAKYHNRSFTAEVRVLVSEALKRRTR